MFLHFLLLWLTYLYCSRLFHQYRLFCFSLGLNAIFLLSLPIPSSAQVAMQLSLSLNKKSGQTSGNGLRERVHLGLQPTPATAAGPWANLTLKKCRLSFGITFPGGKMEETGLSQRNRLVRVLTHKLLRCWQNVFDKCNVSVAWFQRFYIQIAPISYGKTYPHCLINVNNVKIQFSLAISGPPLCFSHLL